jgi:TolB-like protein
MSQSRQLAAIMFADIVGYTALMQASEQQALANLQKFKEQLERDVAENQGKIIQFYGDGCLVIFYSSVDAVVCAQSLQKEFQLEPKVPVRIGLHTGDVVFRDDNVFGDAVNIASRVESLGVPGAVLLSSNVRNQIKNHPEYKLASMGSFEFKNIDESMTIYALANVGLLVPNKEEITGKLKEVKTEKTIAVLPFSNMSSDPEQEYFSDGLTEEIIADLSQIHTLKVISRTSVMVLKNANKDLKTIGKELGAQYILEGSVRKSGDRLRITAQLIDAVSDQHLWAEKYKGTMEDVFDLQEEVSRQIVSALNIKLTKEESLQIANRPVENVKAYELYQKAQYEIFQWKEDGLKRALQYLDDALKIEGENPFLYSKMGATLLSLMNVLIKVDRSIFKKVRQLADKVFKLSPNSPMGHILLGYLSFYEGNIRDAVIQVQTAYNSNPNDHDNLWLLILGYSYLGQSEEAEKYSVLMRKVDPYNPVYHALLALVFYMKGDLEKAFEEINKAYQIYPKIPQVQLYYAYFSMLNGNKHQAISVLERYISDTSGSIFAVIGKLFKAAIQNPDQNVILTAEEEEKLKIDVEWSWLIADFYSMMKRNEQALDWLEHAVNRGFINYPLFATYDPFLENLREERRFLNLMDKVKHSYDELMF